MTEPLLILTGLNLRPERLVPLTRHWEKSGFDPVPVPLTGFSPSHWKTMVSIGPDDWLADLDRTWQTWAAPDGALEQGRPVSILGYSLGALLGCCWALERNVSLRRMIMLAPAWRLRPSLQNTLRLLCKVSPAWLSLPVLAPRAYVMRGYTTISAYRALTGLQDRLQTLWPEPARQPLPGNPAMFVAYSPRDEFLDTKWMDEQCSSAGNRWVRHHLNFKPRRFYTHHLGMDEATLGRTEWERLLGEMDRFSEQISD